MHFPFLIKIHDGQTEKPQIFMRKHPVILFGQIALYLFLACLPFIASVVLGDVVGSWLAADVLGPVILLLLSLFELFVVTLLYSAFMDWYLDVWVVTDERIIDVNQHGVFGREIAELQLAKVQDVASEQRGAFATIFGYGKIRVQSAGERVQFEFDGIPKPNEIARMILELAQADMHFHEAVLAGHIKGLK
jgi:uncharacterized membrane protein YdbT with pleckstrin-like domain